VALGVVAVPDEANGSLEPNGSLENGSDDLFVVVVFDASTLASSVVKTLREPKGSDVSDWLKRKNKKEPLYLLASFPTPLPCF